MKVKDLIEALNKCNPEYEVFCGYTGDNMLDSNTLVEVVEMRTVSNKKDLKSVADGVYIRMN